MAIQKWMVTAPIGFAMWKTIRDGGLSPATPDSDLSAYLLYFLSFQSFAMSSRVLPFVSGTSRITNIAATMHMTP